jgi:hypothetical protein
MAGKPALASPPVTQEPYRNRDCEDSRAHSFCHAKYTHVSQTLWRGLPRGGVRDTGQPHAEPQKRCEIERSMIEKGWDLKFYQGAFCT